MRCFQKAAAGKPLMAPLLAALALLCCLACPDAAQADCSEDLRNCQRSYGIALDDVTICQGSLNQCQNYNLVLAGSITALSAPLMSPATLNFGGVSSGSTDQTRTVTVTANQAGTVLSDIGLSGAQPDDFILSGTCAKGATLGVRESCTVIVTLNPTDTGSRSATLTVTTTSPAATLTTTLGGIGTIDVSCIAIDPAVPATVYSGLDGKGIYKSTNSGSTWTAATTQPTTAAIKAVVVKPGDGTKLFAATKGGGVFMSTDAGVTWSPCGNAGLTSLNVVSLAIDRTGSLYAGTDSGVFTSSDSGATWNAMNTGLPS